MFGEVNGLCMIAPRIGLLLADTPGIDALGARIFGYIMLSMSAVIAICWLVYSLLRPRAARPDWQIALVCMLPYLLVMGWSVGFAWASRADTAPSQQWWIVVFGIPVSMLVMIAGTRGRGD